jgi:hypothetical protein
MSARARHVADAVYRDTPNWLWFLHGGAVATTACRDAPQASSRRDRPAHSSRPSSGATRVAQFSAVLATFAVHALQTSMLVR